MNQNNVGLKVGACRRKMGFTRDELALLSQVERTEITEIEHGMRDATLRDLLNLADALQVTVGKFLARLDAPDEAPIRKGLAPAVPKARTILIVEDNPTDAALTVRAFKVAGIANQLVVAKDAEQGMEYLFGTGVYAKEKPAKPQLIVLDLNLPGMSGIEFLRRVKGYPSTLHVPVVVLTATRNDHSIKECGRLGAESYIVKPLSLRSSVKETPNLTPRRSQMVYL